VLGCGSPVVGRGRSTRGSSQGYEEHFWLRPRFASSSVTQARYAGVIKTVRTESRNAKSGLPCKPVCVANWNE
jgi:hypothetical protein